MFENCLEWLENPVWLEFSFVYLVWIVSSYKNWLSSSVWIHNILTSNVSIIGQRTLIRYMLCDKRDSGGLWKLVFILMREMFGR